MSKEKLKQNENPVGADASVRPNSRGITLIALIITIIVMLILVGVSVTVALKGELFSTAKQASAQTQEERDKELALDEGKVEVNEKLYSSIDEYVNGNSEREETVTTGTPVGSTDELKAKQVKAGDLVYVANSDGETATVYGYKADADDYSIGMPTMNAPTITTNSIQIASKVQIGENVYTVNTIGNYAFAGMMVGVGNLESVSIPNTVTRIGASAFFNCTNLAQVTIPGNVTAIGSSAFSGTLWLTTQKESNDGLLIINRTLFDGMTAPGDETGNITISDTVNRIATNAFIGTNATSITIPSSVTTVESNAIGMMTNTLTTINVSWEEGSKPAGWADDWNGSPATVVYGYTGQSE